MVSDGGADAGRSAEQPEERKTETTLTTRIRINIPGSRPIPPVVVRTPVADAEADDTATDTPPAGAATSTGTVEAPAGPAPAAEEKTSDWFAPRKSPANKSGQGAGSANGAGLPGGSGAGASGGSGAPGGAGAGASGAGAGGGAGTGVPGAATGASGAGAPSGAGASGGAGAPGGARPADGRPGGVVGSMSVPGGARPGGPRSAGVPGATGGPVAPGHGGGTGSFDVTEALAAGPLGSGSRPGPGGAGEQRREGLPYFSEDGRGSQNGFGGTNAQDGAGGGPGAPGGPVGFNGPGGRGGQGGPQGPAGPTAGPVTGDGPMVPPPGGAAGAPAAAGAPGVDAGTGRPGAPGAAGTSPFAGRGPVGGMGGGMSGGLSDDTAILTPQKPAPEPGPNSGYARHDNVSGHTVTSGIPVVPPGDLSGPFGPGASTEGPLPHTPPRLPEPVPQNAPNAAPKKKKGRNKLVLLAGGMLFIAVGAYGAGLLMNHSDVPKGTTVLGVDIGGGTRDEAVKKLDDAFGKRVDQPLKLSLGGETVTLKPDQAGLQFDMQATVAAAANSDYNPVSVIGSLFGEHREVEPVMPVDEEKLQAALETAAGASGSVTEGTIRFESGKAVAVYGKAGKGIAVAQAKESVEEAYRAQVETGTTTAVEVPTTARQPTISNAEVDRMMKEFAEPAMSAKVTVMTDAAHSVAFSPKNSLWKFLEVKAIDGKLVESYNEAALKELYGGTFDGVLITRGTGQKTAVTVQDVISALRPALTSKTDRVAVIDPDPS